MLMEVGRLLVGVEWKLELDVAATSTAVWPKLPSDNLEPTSFPNQSQLNAQR